MNDTPADSAGPGHGKDPALDAIIAERHIIDVITRSVHYLDYAQADLWVSVFTQDGVYEIRSGNPAFLPAGGTCKGTSVQYRGREELGAMVSNRPERSADRHIVANTFVTVSGDTATATSYRINVTSTGDGMLKVANFGRYFDSLVLSEDGQWRISVRVTEMEG